MGKVISRICFLLVLIFSVSSGAFAQGGEMMATEMLLFEEIPMVFTAGKRAQKITEAPAAISIITAEDIKMSGATHFGEIFNMIPGMNFGYTTSNYNTCVGIRGMNKLPANKIALLIDGTPWTFEAYGIAFMNPLPIALEEIERVEVMRGPGSSLYGANATLGVINIITKKAKDTQGHRVDLSAGEFNTFYGNYRFGGSVKDKAQYRVSYGWGRRDGWGYAPFSSDPVEMSQRFNADIDYKINDNSSINIAGGYVDIDDLELTNETTAPIDYGDSELYKATIAYKVNDPNILLRAFWEYQDFWNGGWTKGSRALYFEQGHKGLDFQHTFEPFENDILVWGTNFTSFMAKAACLGGRHVHDTWGTFFDNTYKFNDKLGVNIGARYDFHPNTGDNVSHRLSMLYEPVKDHHLRVTWATSFRNPDFVETYYYNSIGYIVKGNVTNNAEKVESTEVAYRGQLTDRLSLESNFFYHKITDFVYFYMTGVSPVTFQFLNIENFYTWGNETEFKYKFTPWLTGVANYTYMDQWEEDLARKAALDMTPQHMYNLQLRGKWDNGWNANLSFHYRATTLWRTYTWAGDPRGTAVGGGKAKDYTICNLHVGYAFKAWGNDAEFSINAFNLFDTRYQDYPISTQEISRRVTGKITYKF